MENKEKQELNEQVARKLGFIIIEKEPTCCDFPDEDPPHLHGHRNDGTMNVEINGVIVPNVGFRTCVPDYVGSIAAAWEIIDSFKDGDNIELVWILDGYAKGKWKCVFEKMSQVGDYPSETETEYFEAKADTAPEAIVKAFLKLP